MCSEKRSQESDDTVVLVDVVPKMSNDMSDSADNFADPSDSRDVYQ